MEQHPRLDAPRVLVVVTVGWALLAVVACVALPLVTVHRGATGEQPMVPLVTSYGLSGLPPGGLLLVAALVTGLLLRRGRAVQLERWRVVAVSVWSGAVLVCCLAGSLLSPRGGLVLLPFGLLVVATAAVAWSSRSARMRG
ncbi:hypothetical protein ACUN7V_18070 [Quadrisphaera oryzae]|uniref:hypothetical protein n=1 Tax=Quadrisphaera TaxID=317661 RepID=UPI001C9618CF